MVKTKLKYVIPTFFTCFSKFSPRPRAPKGSWAGATHESLWARNLVQKWGRSSPTRCHSAAILPIPSRATSFPFGICSVAMVNAKVTDRVICVFHALFTFQRCKYRSRLFRILESDTSKRPRKWKSSIKMFPSDPLETVPSICMVESSPSLLYLLGNLQLGKSKKKLQSPGGFPGRKRTAVHGPLFN